MLPRKKQKLEQEVAATLSGRREQLASGSLGKVSTFHESTMKDGTPEPSGTNLKWQEGPEHSLCQRCTNAV